MTKRALFVTYQFPPVGGAGVQRVTKFIKYLPCYGWQASVLTVANPSVPAFDESLLVDVSENVLVRRARTWEPSYQMKTAVSGGEGRSQIKPSLIRGLTKAVIRRLANLVLQPDVQVLWMPAALREGKRLLREVEHAAIIATGPPFSTFVLASALSRWSGLPLVLDYRDEWDLSNACWENRNLGIFGRYVQRHIQRSVVRSAKALVATTRASARTLDAVRASASSKARVTWIYNGFDRDDFPHRPSSDLCADGIYRIIYVGTLWNLASAAPLVNAIEVLARKQHSLAAKLELVFAGRRTSAQEQILGRLDALPCRVVRQPYIDHPEAIALIRSADAVCILLADQRGAERVVPAKLFEYVAARKAILSVGPRGEVWELLRDYPGAMLFEPGDVEGISNCLAEQIGTHGKSAMALPADWDASRYERRNQAGQLVEILEALN